MPNLARDDDDKSFVPVPFDVRRRLSEEVHELPEVLFAQASRAFSQGISAGVRAV